MKNILMLVGLHLTWPSASKSGSFTLQKNQSCCMELKHREPRPRHRRRSRHSSTPALEEFFGSDGLRPSATDNSGNRPSNNQQKIKSSKNAGDGLDTPSESKWPVSHVSPWPGTHREKESKAAQETPGAVIWRLKQRCLGQLERLAQDWMSGGLLYAAYAPLGAKCNDDDDNDFSLKVIH